MCIPIFRGVRVLYTCMEVKVLAGQILVDSVVLH